MRSMLADHPYSDVVRTQGESAMRELTMTFSTLSAQKSEVEVNAWSKTESTTMKDKGVN